jgi:hypothetical protein
MLLAKIWDKHVIARIGDDTICSMSIVICCTISAGRAACSTSRAGSMASIIPN